MKPQKVIYKDENELIDEFCRRMNCKRCYTSKKKEDVIGEGCQSMIDWVCSQVQLVDIEEDDV